MLSSLMARNILNTVSNAISTITLTFDTGDTLTETANKSSVIIDTTNRRAYFTAYAEFDFTDYEGYTITQYELKDINGYSLFKGNVQVQVQTGTWLIKIELEMYYNYTVIQEGGAG